MEASYTQSSREFLNRYFPGYKNLDWHYAYSSVSGIREPNYIPEDLFFTKIEPGLNSRLLSGAYTDKNSYSLFHPKEHMPATYLRVIGGQYYDAGYSLITIQKANDLLKRIPGDCVLKPSLNSGKGRNVVVGAPGTIRDILFEPKPEKYKNSIVQERISQHKGLSQIYGDSLNTMRITTGRIGSQVVTLKALLRFGANQLSIDNLGGGGIVCGVYPDGRITDFGLDMDLQKSERHPSSNISFENFTIPGFTDACQMCLSFHKKYAYFHIVSWDVGIRDNEKPVLIELNLSKQDVFYHQLFCGPLFGEHTGYFLNLAKKNRWMYDFNNGMYFHFYA